MTETILFELRVTERGVEITESDEWLAYHAEQGRDVRSRGRDVRAHGRHMRFERRTPRLWEKFPTPETIHGWGNPFKHRLRHELDALQSIYDDLYSASAGG
jgi:hypothetical protein